MNTAGLTSSATDVEAGIDDLEDLFENAPCGYISADKDGRISRANATLAGWLGCASEALVGRRFSDLLTTGGKIFYETHFAPMLRMQGSFSEVALDLACSDGRKLPVIVNAIERRDDRGRACFVRITIFNASERRRYERNLLEAKAQAEQATEAQREALVLREQFIAILSHDLRNPLAALASGTRILEKEPLSARGRKVLTLMNGSVVRATSLIENVLDFARARLAGDIGVTFDARNPLQPVIEQVVAELRSIAPDRVIETSIDIAEPVEADEQRIGQLTSNLLGNSLSHGAVDRPVQLVARTVDDQFELSVANGGEAIPPDVLSRIFEPFVRGTPAAGQAGLGLGLHIATEIAKAHNGTLTVSSDANETRFTFRMPLRRS